jgi:MarR family transcriptional regulator, lower aerobic nicotinate degradation pathway regulator
MDYQLLREVIDLMEKFETTVDPALYSKDVTGFKRWIHDDEGLIHNPCNDVSWEGKENGRSPDSEINTLIVHMNRYAKTYSRSAIYNSPFNTQEEFIYLIVLRALGAMTKTELIKKNLQEKPVGMQIINRLIKQGWIEQSGSQEDKRSKVISITPKGIKDLEDNMGKIRQATRIVTGKLSDSEKMQLIRLLQKLDHFHQAIYSKNIEPAELVNVAYNQFLLKTN